jgi:hypothetical protein
MTTEQMDARGEGLYLRKSNPAPQHVCQLPPESESRDVWLCGRCRRMYIWSTNAAYGFWWNRVWFRYWWFRLGEPS